MKQELKRVAALVLAVFALSGVLGVTLTVGAQLFAERRDGITVWAAVVAVAKGWRLCLDIGAIGALLAAVFLRAVALPRALVWIAAGMIVGSLAGAVLSFGSEIRAWIVAYMIGGTVIGLVAACVRLWGAERASRGLPVRVGTLLAK